MYIIQASDAVKFIVLCRILDDRHLRHMKNPTMHYVILHVPISGDLRVELDALGCTVTPI